MPNVDTVDGQRRTLDQEISTGPARQSGTAGYLTELGYVPFAVNTVGSSIPSPFQIWHIGATGSTNVDLVEAARHGEADRTVLVADHQRAGKGRQDRVWLDRPGTSLLSSVYWTVPVSALPLLPLAVGLAVADAVESLAAGLNVSNGDNRLVTLKWPNDVLVPRLGDRKLAGILAESAPVSGRVDTHGVVIGMGMNLRSSEDAPRELRDRMATLSGALGSDVAAREVLSRYLEALANRLDQVEPATVIGPYRDRCSTLGRSVRFETAAGVVNGTAVDIDPSGALEVVDSAGYRHHLRSGDAHHV